MAYKCLKCGHIFEEGEQAVWKESRGEFWGMPCHEVMSGCPICRSEYGKTNRCSICQSEQLEEDLHGGVCDDCIDVYRNNFEKCHNLPFVGREEIEINSVLVALLEPFEIEHILEEYIKSRCPDIDCSAYIDDDVSWFGEQLGKEVKESEKSKN